MREQQRATALEILARLREATGRAGTCYVRTRITRLEAELIVHYAQLGIAQEGRQENL